LNEFRRKFKFCAYAAALAAGAALFLPSAGTAAVKPALPSAFEVPDDVPLPDPDLWQRIRVGFAMEALDSPLVQEHEAWYSSRPDYIKRFVDRGSRYLHYIVEQVEKRGMPTEIALLPVVESAFTPRAQSRAKASGIWQFIPSTGKNYGLTQDWWHDNRNDVVAATDAALNYLQKLYDQFGSWELALAAYNCGEGCVGRAIAANQKRGLPTDYLSLNLPPETRNYVPKLIAVKNIVLAPNTYGVELESVPDKPYFTTVRAPSKIDVKVAARLAGMSEEEFIALNPSHTKPVAVSSTGTLVVPVDKADAFRENLENYDKPLVTWTTYMAKRGESLDAIARRHNVSLVQLRAVNDPFKLDRKGRMKVAGPVLVPVKSGKAAPMVRMASASVPTASVGGGVRPAAHVQAGVHVVKPGETLYSIATRYHTGVDALRALNKLGAHGVIHPGLRLRLP